MDRGTGTGLIAFVVSGFGGYTLAKYGFQPNWIEAGLMLVTALIFSERLAAYLWRNDPPPKPAIVRTETVTHVVTPKSSEETP